MKRLISFLLPALVLAGCKSGEETEAKPIVDVSVQRAASTNLPLTVTAPGTVFGRNEAHISSRITAVVQQMLVHKGDRVRKGQLLVVLDQRDLAAQRADAVAGVTSAQAALQKTQTGTIPTALTQARGDVQAKKAALDLATKVVTRREQLLQQGAISERDLQSSRAQLAQAEADYNAAQKSLDVLEHHTGADDTRMAQSAVAQSKAREALANANLQFANLRSPFDGSVVEQAVFVGDMANPGTSLLTIDDLSRAVARAQVNVEEAGAVKLGQVCSFAQKDDESNKRYGRVTAVNQAVDPARRTIEVWCEIQNADGVLKDGFFGDVQIGVGNAPNAIVLPSSAVEFEEGSSKAKVYVVDGQHVAHVREVTAKAVDAMHVRILSGLNPGETVITSGEYGIPDGTQVNPAGAAK